MDTGPKRDLLRLLSEAARKKGLKFGVSYSLYQWPLALENEYEKDENQSTTVWSDVKQLVNEYKPSVLRFEGDWEANEFYKASPEFMAWIYNDSPVRHDVVVTDSWDMLPPCLEELHYYGTGILLFLKKITRSSLLYYKIKINLSDSSRPQIWTGQNLHVLRVDRHIYNLYT